MPTRTGSLSAPISAADVTVGKLTRERFAELACWSGEPCVTIMAPVVDGAYRAAGILVKDLARAARNELSERETSRDLAADLLAPADAFQFGPSGDPSIRGVAVLSAPGMSVTLAMGTTPPELAVVGPRFVITPLLAELAPTGAYHLLALSEHRARLFRGTVDRLEPVRVPHMPRRLDDLIPFDHVERRRGHVGGAGIGGRFGGATHSGRSERDMHDERLWRFFRSIDDAVAEVVRTPRPRLLVAGIGHELAIYQDASRFDRLESIEIGNPDRLSASALRARCASKTDDMLDRPRRARMRAALQASSTIRTLPEIVDACIGGRADTLFVRPDRLAWGDPGRGARSASASRQPGDTEWHSEAIGAALAHRTNVFAARPGELPDDVPAVASLRF